MKGAGQQTTQVNHVDTTATAPLATPNKRCKVHKQQQQRQRRSANAVEAAAVQLHDRSLLGFERRGFLVTKQLLQQQQVQAVKDCVQQVIAQDTLIALKHRVRVLCPGWEDLNSIKSEQQAMRVIQQQGNSQLGFLQFFNLHRSHATVAALVRDRQLCATAAALLGAKKLRLYQDCVFLKQPGFAETNWHSDLRMAPLDTNDFVTAWIPLRPVRGGQGDSGLVFAVGSHRDFALPFWHNLHGRDLADRGYLLDGTGAMSVGDVSWHHGWLLHAAGPQPQDTQPRLAIAVSFFADGAKLLARQTDPSVLQDMLHDEDAESYGEWLQGMKDGCVARHPLLPLVYP
eukprot:gene1462-1804_t